MAKVHINVIIFKIYFIITNYMLLKFKDFDYYEKYTFQLVNQETFSALIQQFLHSLKKKEIIMIYL